MMVICRKCGKEYDLSQEFPIKCDNCQLYKFKMEDYDNLILSLLEKYEKIHKNLNEFSYLSNGKLSINNINLKKTDIKNKEKYVNKEISAEKLVMEYYNSQGYNVIYSENNYWLCLIFMIGNEKFDILKAYHNRRENLDNVGFNKYVDHIDYSVFNNIHKILVNIFENFLRYQKNSNNIFSTLLPDDSAYYSVLDLCNAVLYLQPKQLELIFKRILYDFSGSISGLPDLIVFNENKFFFVEIKSKKDQLRYNQIQWHKYLTEIVKIDVVLFTIDKSDRSIKFLKNKYEDSKLINYKNKDRYFSKITLSPKIHTISCDEYETLILVYSIHHTIKNEGIKEFYRIIEFTREEYENYKSYLKNERIKMSEFLSAISKKYDAFSDLKSSDYVPTKKQKDRNKEAKLLVSQNEFQKAIELYEKNIYEKCVIHETYNQLCKLYLKNKNFDKVIDISLQAISIFYQFGDKYNPLKFFSYLNEAWAMKSHWGYFFIELLTEEENNYLYDNCGKNSVKKEVEILYNQIKDRYRRNESLDGLVVTSNSKKNMFSISDYYNYI